MALFMLGKDRYRPPFQIKYASIVEPYPRQCARFISTNIRYETNGLVSMFPVPKAMQPAQHNSGTGLLSLPPEIRNTIFKEILGHRAVHIYAIPSIETREHSCGYVYEEDERALTRVCR
jgi:hypothetical protein